MPSFAPAGRASFLAPERLYSFAGFLKATGVTRSRVQEAKKKGLPFPALKVGRRLFVHGDKAIAYLDQLAEITLREKALKKQSNSQGVRQVETATGCREGRCRQTRNVEGRSN